MKSSFSEKRRCCSTEKKRLMKELKKCDLCSMDNKEYNQCYRDVARHSGQRSRACIMS